MRQPFLSIESRLRRRAFHKYSADKEIVALVVKPEIRAAVFRALKADLGGVKDRSRPLSRVRAIDRGRMQLIEM